MLQMLFYLKSSKCEGKEFKIKYLVEEEVDENEDGVKTVLASLRMLSLELLENEKD